MVKKRILGTRVDLVSQSEAVEIISSWVVDSGKTRLVATAYSEFFVNGLSDKDFRMALEGSDLVTPDGIGPLAAIRYQLLTAHCSWPIFNLLTGFRVGIDVLRGRVGRPVSGYWLFQTLVEKAAKEGWSVFLLGGFGETASRLTQELKESRTQELKIGFEAGGQNEAEMTGEANEAVIEKINKFKPDLLFVAYGPGKQEKWLAKYRNDLKVKVAMGVGGTFDEALGLVREAPVAFSKYGLKWLWRLLQQPQRLPRIFKATIVFAWSVFADSLKKK